MIHGPSSLFIWRLVYVSWFSEQSLSLRIFALSLLIPRVILILVRKPLGTVLTMIHGPSSLFIWRLVDVSWFSSIDERCVFSRGTFMSLRTFALSFLIPRVILILVRKPLGTVLSMIHGPSSLFIWRLVDVSWFSSIDERCVFSRGTFMSLRTFALSFLIPRVILILVRKPLEWLFDYDPWSF